jgi:hypothetical protein
MTVEAAFAKELSRLQNSDDGFLASVRNDRKFDFSLLNIEYRVRDISLREHVLTFAKFEDRFSGPDLGQESLGIKRVLGRFNQDGTPRSLDVSTLPYYHNSADVHLF